MNKTLVYILLFLAAAAVGFGAMYFLEKDNTEKQPVSEKVAYLPEEPVTAEPESPEAEPIIATPAPAPAAGPKETPQAYEHASAVPVESATSEPQFEIDLSKKKIEAVGDGVFRLSGIRIKGGSGNVKYTLRDGEGHYYESKDGTFPEVQSNAKGSYTLKATDMTTKETAKPKYLSGFKNLKPVERLSTAEIEAVLNSGNGDNLNSIKGRLVAKPRVICDDPSVTTMSAVITRVWMEGLKASVTNVKYDASGKVSSITVVLQ